MDFSKNSSSFSGIITKQARSSIRMLPRARRKISGCLGHGDQCFKQVSIHHQFKGSSLQLGQAAGNGQPQPGSFRGTGGIPPDKAFHQTLCRNVQCLSGHIFDGQRDTALAPDELNVDSCPLQSVFGTVAQQIIARHRCRPSA